MDFPPEQSSKQHEHAQSMSFLTSDLTSAIKTNIVPNQEYFLQGSIYDKDIDVLIHRLRGLCDNVDLGPESFYDHEVCFVLLNNTNQPGPPLSLRVRRAVDDPQAAWLLRYVGLPELGDKNRPTMIRNVLDVACGKEAFEFLKELGCRREFEFLTKGHIFRKGRLKITVGKLYKFDPTKSPDATMEGITGSHYVEMSVVTPSGHDAVGDDMKTLAEQLKPLVLLDKVDQRR
jgi:mediator of RNA polymerase II transcription subunit 18